MWKHWLIVLALIVVVFGGIFGGKYYVTRRAALAAESRGFPPVSVATTTAKEATWSPTVRAVGALQAVSGTAITAQIAGNITKIAFRSGTPVKKGDLLVQIDDTTQLAQLHADLATLRNARFDAVRATELYRQRVTSLAAMQKAQANEGTAEAAVEGDRATLQKLRISAPFNGVVGIRQVSLGQYVSPGTPIVNLESYDPIFLNFSLPQSSLRDLALGQSVAFSVDAFPGTSFPGRITALGSSIDPATRNINVQATLANPKDLLRPGLYGTVTLSFGSPLHGVAVPDTAIAYSTFGDTVFVVESADHRSVAHARIVHVLTKRGGSTLLSAGVKAGEVVVVAGQNKLRDGASVAIHDGSPS